MMILECAWLELPWFHASSDISGVRGASACARVICKALALSEIRKLLPLEIKGRGLRKTVPVSGL